MKTTHTPGPWVAQPPRGHQHAIDRKREIVSPILGGGELVVVGEHTGIDCLKEADAAFIVRACNSHYELLAALESAAESIEQLVKVGRIPANNAGLRDARAAIAKAKG